MLNRIIRIIGTALCSALLLAGCCVRLDNPAPQRAISFSAGTALLQDGATKTGTSLKTGNTFVAGDKFRAWAWHKAANQNFEFGSALPVTLGDNGLWDYSPKQFWSWREGEDYYDFLAIYPDTAIVEHPNASLESPLVKSVVTYDPTTTQYDLMAAGLRRTDKSIDSVALSFSHVLSAVSVDIKNAAGSNVNGQPDTITVQSIGFTNLIAFSYITITFNGTGLEYSRSGDRNENAVLGPDFPGDSTVRVAPGYGYPSKRLIPDVDTWLQANTSLTAEESAALADKIYKDDVWDLDDTEYLDWIATENPGLTPQQAENLKGQIAEYIDWDLMIPQSLDPTYYYPCLQIVYKNQGDNGFTTQEVPLKEIKNKVTNLPITSWNPGVKYRYEIELRIGVGIVVTVTTTPWTVVEAETPGLMI